MQPTKNHNSLNLEIDSQFLTVGFRVLIPINAVESLHEEFLCYDIVSNIQ